MTFDKKLYFNIEFDDVKIKIYTSKYNKGLPKKYLGNQEDSFVKQKKSKSETNYY